MDSANTAGATPPSAPVYPVFAAVAVGMTGRTVYQVIDTVGGIFEAVGAVFEGSPDAPGTLIALLPPSDNAAVRAVELGLQAQTIEAALRIGVDAVEVHTKKEQDARWQQVIDSAVRLEKAARTGEAIAGEAHGCPRVERGAGSGARARRGARGTTHERCTGHHRGDDDGGPTRDDRARAGRSRAGARSVRTDRHGAARRDIATAAAGRRAGCRTYRDRSPR
jgi:hypothetical protein